MGTAVARALAQQCDVTVWNRTRSKAEPLEALGICVAADVKSAVEAGRDVIFAHVNSCGDLRSILGHDGVSLAGKTLLNLVTGTPAEIRELQDFVEAAGGRFLTGVVMAFPEQVGTADSKIMACGPMALWKEIEPIARIVAPAFEFLGESVTNVHIVEMVMVGCVFWTSVAAFLEGAAYARREGLPVSDLARFLPATLAAIDSEIRKAIEQIESKDYSADQVRIATLDHDYGVYRKSLTDVGASDTILAAVHEKIRKVVASGGQDRSIASLFEV